MELLPKYRVIVEIGKHGFISRQYDTLIQAKGVYKIHTMFVPRAYLDDDGQFILQNMRDSTFIKYMVTEKYGFIERTKEYTGNGEYFIALIEVNPESFCLKSYIKERQNIGFVDFLKGTEVESCDPFNKMVHAN